MELAKEGIEFHEILEKLIESLITDLQSQYFHILIIENRKININIGFIILKDDIRLNQTL